MSSVGKIAVSLPRSTLRKLERAKTRAGTSRSAIVADALEHFLSAERTAADDARYVAGYLARPEGDGASAAVAGAAVAAWEPWE